MLTENEKLILDTLELFIDKDILQINKDIEECESDLQRKVFMYTINILEKHKTTIRMLKKSIGQNKNK